jgi:hypothetical protein
MSAPADLPYRLTHITVKLSPSLLFACFCNRNTFIGWIVDVCRGSFTSQAVFDF